jgi:AcrR family transcriptional regulator
MVGTIDRRVGRTYKQKAPEQRRAERRERLFGAGLATFGTRGYLQTSIEELCSEASVSTRSFYEEFGSREGLLTALHDRINTEALEAVVAALDGVGPDDVTGRARAGVRAYFTAMTSDARWARIAVVESVGVSAEMEAHRRAALERFSALIESEADRLAASGAVVRRDHSLTAVALVGALLELVNTWSPDRDPQQFLDEVTDEAARLIVAALVHQ